MKKIIIAILAFIYLGVSTGIAMNVHYCMDKISSVDLTQGKDKCGKCGMKKGNNGCCRDEFKIVKLSDAHKLISNEINLLLPVAVLNNDYNLFKADLKISKVKCSNSNNSSPHLRDIPLNILHCTFRI